MLSAQPTKETLAFAELYMDNLKNPTKPPTLTWQDILSEEPFEGQHWEGVYGLPPGSTVEGWELESGGSTPSLSPLDDSDDGDDTLSSLDSGERPLVVDTPLPSRRSRNTVTDHRLKHAHREELEKLRSRQYWRADWHPETPLKSSLDIGDPSSLGKFEYDA
jgi:gamma-tubulin complex component 5